MAIALTVVLTATLLMGCTADSSKSKNDYTNMNIDYRTRADGSTYTVYNGKAQEFFGVAEGKENVVDITVKKEAGTLKITIHEENNPKNILYEGHDFPAEHFTVTAKAAGRYRILIEAKDFIGTYRFSYDMWQ